jgi:hypothetical protein
MIHPRIFRQAAVAAMILQIVLAVVLHFLTVFPVPVGLILRLAVAAGGGFLYGREYGRGIEACTLGGALAGGIGIAPAALLSVILGDASAQMIALAVGAGLLAGGVGGAIGLWAADRNRSGF